MLAHILSMNEVPAGAEALSLKPGVLENIFVSKKGGAATPAVANFTLVQAVGCLARGPNQEWLLTKASEPATTREEPPLPPTWTRRNRRRSARSSSGCSACSSRTPLKRMSGDKVEARGLVLRHADGNRLNLTSLQMLDARCGS